MYLDMIIDILAIVISLTLLIFADKKFNIRRKLRSKFLTDDTYRFTLTLIIIITMIIHNFISEEPFMTNTLGYVMLFSYLYLTNVSGEKQ